ncbi:MAG: ComF family protein [Pseudomonadota bacterium]
MGALLDTLFPPECAACRAPTDSAHGLCSECWADTAFISGPVCDSCGVPVAAASPAETLRCDGCLARPPAWDRGRAAVLYDGRAREVILRLKHRDRLDLAAVLARWLARAGGGLLAEADLLAPVPLHWTRLLHRRANQAAELIRQPPLRRYARPVPGLLERQRATQTLKGKNRTERAQILAGSIRVASRHAAAVAGKRVLLVDDVMTTGATLSACAEALRGAGAAGVDVLVIARVAKDQFAPI